uniref:Uncharacterized protein n=1 Tax=Arundo donax TaxID=35708 RepID=A0A0A9BNW6_ARUDO
MQHHLPSFLKMRSLLQLEEHRIGESAKVQAATALLVHANSINRARPPSLNTSNVLSSALSLQ